jgi:hypothetical protein
MSSHCAVPGHCPQLCRFGLEERLCDALHCHRARWVVVERTKKGVRRGMMTEMLDPGDWNEAEVGEGDDSR